MSSARQSSGLEPLGEQAGVFAALEWLGLAFRLPSGYRVGGVTRTGLSADDPMTIRFDGLGEDQPGHVVRLEKQSQALRGTTLRAVIGSGTCGRLRIPYYGEKDASEIYVALCLAADQVDEIDATDEARHWIDETVKNATVIHGYSLKTAAFDALAMLGARRTFDKRAASALIAYRDDGEPGPKATAPLRPALLIDKTDSHRYLRTGETLAYVRNLLTPKPMAQARFDALLAEIGVRRVRCEQRSPVAHYRMSFYVLPDPEGA